MAAEQPVLMKAISGNIFDSQNSMHTNIY